MNYTTINECRLCRSMDLHQVLNFGEVPLANAYPKSQEEVEQCYPLSVAKCANCGHVQLEQTVAPQILFGNYLYSSSDSPALVDHLRGLALRICSRFNPQDKILEIGCNDGALLNHFKAFRAYNIFGVEPATHLAEKAKESGATIFNEYFSPSLAKRIREEHGAMNVICATNTFAHIADLEGLVSGIASLLSRNGVFIFENAYLLDTVMNGYFDQVYHEHLQYYGVRPLIGFFARFGLEIFDIEHLDTQGGSIRVYVKNMYDRTMHPWPELGRWVTREERAGIYSNSLYKALRSGLCILSSKFSNFISGLKTKGATISCYGCPAKFTLLSHRFGMGTYYIDYVVDDSPLKQGRFTPGKKIPIVSNAHFQAHPTDYCVMTAWNMADAIIRQNPQYRGKWVHPFNLPETCVG